MAAVTLPAGEPTPPVWLTPEALAVWRRVAPDLAAAGVLAVVDGDVLAAYCCHAAIVAQCQIEIAAAGLLHTTPGGHEQTSPHYSILHRSTRLMAALASDLGLNPASRMRVKPTHVNDDQLTAFLRRERGA